MALSSELTKVQYSGNGSTTPFAVSFIYWDDADIKAILTVDATGVETTQTLTTHYTLSGGSGATGTLTMVTAPPTGTTLTIKSNLSDVQSNNFPIGGRFPSTTVTESLDKLTRLVQQKKEELNRSIKLAESSATTGIVLPEPVASNLLSWNAAGTQMVNIALGAITTAFDTLLTSLASGDFLKYNGTNWINRTAAEVVTDLAVPTLAGANTFAGVNTFNGGLAMGSRLTFATGANIASATTTDISGATGNLIHITGTTTITTWTMTSGQIQEIIFDGILQLTHHATTNKLLTSANITTAAGDRALYHYDGTTVRMIDYQRLDGTPLNPTVLQVVNVTDGAVATATTLMPIDDTIPQNTEGTEFMSLEITPISATSKLVIMVNAVVSVYNGNIQTTCALFVDSTAGALAASAIYPYYSTNQRAERLTLNHVVTSGSTSARTYKVRMGPETTETITFNGENGARIFGGVSNSSITIMEIG